MKVLHTAIAANRLDLAAHTLVLAAIKILAGENGKVTGPAQKTTVNSNLNQKIGCKSS